MKTCLTVDTFLQCETSLVTELITLLFFKHFLKSLSDFEYFTRRKFEFINLLVEYCGIFISHVTTVMNKIIHCIKAIKPYLIKHIYMQRKIFITINYYLTRFLSSLFLNNIANKEKRKHIISDIKPF